MSDSQFSPRYADTYDLLHVAKPYPDEVDFVLRLATEALGHTPKHVLDLACGTGKHLAEFAKRGVTVHGNDLSSGMLECARARLQSAKVEKYHLSNGLMQDVKAHYQPLELATAFYTAAGYLWQPDEFHRFLRNLHGTLAPGGCFFADLWNMHKMATEFSPSRTKTAENEKISVVRKSLVSNHKDKNALQVEFEFDVTDKQKGSHETFKEKHLVRYHTVPELENILSGHGFKLLKHGPFFDEAKTAEDSWNFFVFAQRI